jgi:hypothetical protein
MLFKIGMWCYKGTFVKLHVNCIKVHNSFLQCKMVQLVIRMKCIKYKNPTLETSNNRGYQI